VYACGVVELDGFCPYSDFNLAVAVEPLYFLDESRGESVSQQHLEKQFMVDGVESLDKVYEDAL